MSDVIVRTEDGVVHGAPNRRSHGSAFLLETSCGLKFRQWRYAGKCYGRRPYAAEAMPTLGMGVVDCMTCLVSAGHEEEP